MSRHSNSFSFLPASDAKLPSVISVTVIEPEDYFTILLVSKVEIMLEKMPLFIVREDDTDKNIFETSVNSQSYKTTFVSRVKTIKLSKRSICEISSGLMA